MPRQHAEGMNDMNMDDLNLSPELKEKFKACKTGEELALLAKQGGFELSDDQLDAFAGGDVDWSCLNDDCDTYVCQKVCSSASVASRAAGGPVALM